MFEVALLRAAPYLPGMPHAVQRWILLTGLVLFSVEARGGAVEETLRYALLWGVIPVGSAEVTTLLVEEDGRTPVFRLHIAGESKGLVIRKVPGAVWITAAPPRVVAQMRVKVPVGSVRAVLEDRQSSDPYATKPKA